MSLLDGLVSWWELNEPSGTTAADSHGVNSGTHINTPGVVAGKVDNALSFNGNSGVNCGSHASLDITGALSIGAWIYPIANVGFGAVLDHAQEGTSLENYCMLVTAGTSSPRVWLQWNNGGWQAHSVDNALTLNTWQYVVVTYDAGTVKFYKNGAQIGTTASGLPALATNAGNTCKIARYQVGSQGYFNGRFDEIGLWSKALTLSEAQELWNGGDGLGYGDLAPPQSYELIAEPGAFNWTGLEVELLHNRRLEGGPGAFVFTGLDVELLYHRRMAAEPGAFVFTGLDVELATGGVFVPPTPPFTLEMSTGRHSLAVGSGQHIADVSTGRQVLEVG